MVYTLKLIKVFILQYTEAEAYMESSIGEVMGNITHFFNIKKKFFGNLYVIRNNLIKNYNEGMTLQSF